MNSEASSSSTLDLQHHLPVGTIELNSFDAKSKSHVESGETLAEPSSNVQELPPVDVGWGAWIFCFCALILETLVWGFGFRYVTTRLWIVDINSASVATESFNV